MLTPEQMREIRHTIATNDRQQWQHHAKALLADRAEIRAELEQIREILDHPNMQDKLARGAARLQVDALIERIGNGTN